MKFNLFPCFRAQPDLTCKEGELVARNKLAEILEAEDLKVEVLGRCTDISRYNVNPEKFDELVLIMEELQKEMPNPEEGANEEDRYRGDERPDEDPEEKIIQDFKKNFGGLCRTLHSYGKKLKVGQSAHFSVSYSKCECFSDLDLVRDGARRKNDDWTG